MILWMIINGEIFPYFSRATVRAHTTALNLIIDLTEKAGEASGPKMEAAIRESYSPRLAEQLMGKGGQDQIYDEPQGWDENEVPQVGDAGYFIIASELDWDKGVLRAEDIPGELMNPNFLFPNEELYSTDFENAYFDIEFIGLSFDLNAIEMLLPTAHLQSSLFAKVDGGGRPRPTGRPPKWDWEGVLAYVVSQAQRPDGLPTGPGAQARIEKMMSDWFMREAGDAPATSQIRQRASSISKSLEKPIKTENN